MRSMRSGGALMAMARGVGGQRAQMALVVKRGRELLVAALGEEWNCWRSMNSLLMDLSGDAAM